MEIGDQDEKEYLPWQAPRHHSRWFRFVRKEQPFLWSVGGEHQSKGLEFSFIGQALDNVFVRGGYGYTDTEVKKDKEKPANVGNALANTSKNTGNLFVRYLPTENLYGEIGVTYVGSYYTNINNLNKMDSFNRVDAAIGYSADPWNVTLAVSNLTNKEYWRSDSMPGTPRSFLMRLNYQFWSSLRNTLKAEQ